MAAAGAPPGGAVHATDAVAMDLDNASDEVLDATYQSFKEFTSGESSAADKRKFLQQALGGLAEASKKAKSGS